MPRPAGVIASAVVALLGSLLTLLAAVAMLFAGFAVTNQSVGAPPRGFVFGMALVIAVCAGLGFATVVGLFRLRPWARLSIVIFSGVMGIICVFSMLVMAFVPIPPPANAPIGESTLRAFMIGFYAVPLAIAVWWLLYFNRASTKEAFATGAVGQPSNRPLSISIIAWLFIVGGAVTLLLSMTGMPALIAGFVFQGWSARLVYLFMGAVGTYLGWGLLKLYEQARVLTIVWCGLGLAHGAYFMLSPTARDRMREAKELFVAGPQPQTAPFNPADTTAFTVGIMALSMGVLVAAIWFMVREKPAFQRSTDAVSAP